MKILHTSDWHVGKVLKGRPRLPEQVRVLAEVIDIARVERPDLVIVAGDLYDTAAPGPDATRLVTRALTALRATGAQLVAIGGNHDNGAALDALRPWAEAAGVVLRGGIRDSPAEHVIDGTTGDGQRWRLVALPFVSQRYAVRAVEMYELTAAEANQTYADHLGRLISRLCEGFDTADRVHLITGHLTVVGAQTGGGERDAHTVLGYAVPATVFPGTAHYVALGHLHRAQQVPGSCPIHYCGSPLAVDFGETENHPSVNVVTVGPQTAAQVRRVPITGAATLRTVRGTMAELAELAEQLHPTPGTGQPELTGPAAPTGPATNSPSPPQPESWLRVIVRETPRVGLREQVQALLPQAVEVRVDPELVALATGERTTRRAGRSPRELFADYLTGQGHADDGIRELFDQLYAEVES